jgi:hypothetical protein
MTPDFQRHPHTTAPYVNHPTRRTTKYNRPARVMYGRPSNFGNQIENRFNLERWHERRVLYGAALIDLAGVEQIDIDDPDQVTQLDGLVGDAKKAAGAYLAAQRGTLTHEFAEYVDHHEESPLSVLEYAETLGIPATVIDAQLDAYGRCLDRYDLHVLAIEQTVVDDRWRLAGRLDRIVRLGRDLQFTDGTVMEEGDVVIGDIKTGRVRVSPAGSPEYWNTYAVQIASYAHSVPYIIAEDAWDEARDEWPWEIDQRHGLIIHLDINNAIEEGVATAQLYHVDLVAGHVAGNLCRQARDWQALTNVVQQLAAMPVVVNVR